MDCKSKKLSIKSKGRNFEYPISCIEKNFVTPLYHFFQRNHTFDPPRSNSFTIQGINTEHHKISASELKSNTETMVTLQCAGNRRKELESKDKIPFKKGTVLWSSGAIGNGVFKGEKMASFTKRYFQQDKDLFKDGWLIFIARDRLPEEKIKISAEVSGRDIDDLEITNFSMGVKCRDIFSPLHQDGMLLVTQIKDKDKFVSLPAKFGGPIRAVIGGAIGAKSVKWIQEIRISPHPPVGYYDRIEYRIYRNVSQPKDWLSDIDFVKKHTSRVMWTTLQSAIFTEQAKTTTFMGKKGVWIRGYASCGNELIKGVKVRSEHSDWLNARCFQHDFSNDHGFSWSNEKNIQWTKPFHQKERFAWVFWEIFLLVQENTFVHCKSYTNTKVQSGNINTHWNYRGIQNGLVEKKLINVE